MTTLLIAALAGCGATSSDGGSSNGSLPSGSLIASGTITWCADIATPPLSYYDKKQKAIGTEVELGDALAKSIGLKSSFKNVAFAGIIPALQGRQCDAILSQLYIKPEREKIVDFVPYMFAGNTVLVAKGNPKGITGVDDLCGHKVATETGTTAATILDDEDKKCKAAGKPKIAVSRFGRDSEAQQQLKLKLVDVYATTVETAGYSVKVQPDVFETVGEPFGRIKTGIATTKNNSALHDALTKALADVRQDGTYDAILKKWELQDDALPAS